MTQMYNEWDIRKEIERLKKLQMKHFSDLELVKILRVRIDQLRWIFGEEDTGYW